MIHSLEDKNRSELLEICKIQQEERQEIIRRAKDAGRERDKYAAGKIREFLDDAETECIDGYWDGTVVFRSHLEEFANKLEGVERKDFFE
jgi:methionine synthase II (cobalamin-independent)